MSERYEDQLAQVRRMADSRTGWAEVLDGAQPALHAVLERLDALEASNADMRREQ